VYIDCSRFKDFHNISKLGSTMLHPSKNHNIENTFDPQLNTNMMDTKATQMVISINIQSLQKIII